MYHQNIFDLAANFVNDNSYSHIYGPSATQRTLHLADVIIHQSDDVKLIFVCFRRKASAIYLYESKKGNKLYGLATGDCESYDLTLNKVIYSTTAKFRNILADNPPHLLDRLHWVFIDSWDNYDINSYVITGLIRQHNRGSVKTHIVFLSTSKYTEISSVDIPSFEIPNEDVEIKTTKLNADSLINDLNDTAIYYGFKPPGRYNDNSLVTEVTYLSTSEHAHVVIDSLHNNRSIPITKVIADLRADSIMSGTVYRMINKKTYESLKNNTPITNYVGLQQAVVFLMWKNISLKVLPIKYDPEVEAIVKDLEGFTLAELGRMAGLGIGVLANKFRTKWLNKIGFTNRDKYISSIVTCLIDDIPETYGPLDSYFPFIGRNDIETMFNMWNNLISSTDVPFYEWNDRRGIVGKWSRANNFNPDKISELVKKASNLFTLAERPNWIELFSSISTKELNNVTLLLKEIIDPVMPRAEHITQTKTVSKQPTKTVSKQPTKTVSKQPTKTVSTPPAKTVSTPPTKTVSKSPAKTVSTPPTKTVSKSPAKTVKVPLRLDKSRMLPSSPWSNITDPIIIHQKNNHILLYVNNVLYEDFKMIPETFDDFSDI